MDKQELINGIRLDIQKEEDAIITYTGQVKRTTNSAARKVLTSIANEERVHVGELIKLLELLNGEGKYIADGESEVKKTLNIKVYHRGRLHHVGTHIRTKSGNQVISKVLHRRKS